jgi:hypothetical protein
MARGKHVTNPEQTISARIEIIESSYEYMLAFAAQGRETDEGMAAGTSARETLSELSMALADLGESVIDIEPVMAMQEFAQTLAADAAHARRAVELVLSRPRISSQLVDNLNATIHLRSVLTDLFLIDEALKCQGSSSQD